MSVSNEVCVATTCPPALSHRDPRPAASMPFSEFCPACRWGTHLGSEECEHPAILPTPCFDALRSRGCDSAIPADLFTHGGQGSLFQIVLELAVCNLSACIRSKKIQIDSSLALNFCQPRASCMYFALESNIIALLFVCRSARCKDIPVSQIHSDSRCFQLRHPPHYRLHEIFRPIRSTQRNQRSHP